MTDIEPATKTPIARIQLRSTQMIFLDGLLLPEGAADVETLNLDPGRCRLRILPAILDAHAGELPLVFRARAFVPYPVIIAPDVQLPVLVELGVIEILPRETPAVPPDDAPALDQS